jgi:hypothetical protein
MPSSKSDLARTIRKLLKYLGQLDKLIIKQMVPIEEFANPDVEPPGVDELLVDFHFEVEGEEFAASITQEQGDKLDNDSNKQSLVKFCAAVENVTTRMDRAVACALHDLNQGLTAVRSPTALKGKIKGGVTCCCCSHGGKYEVLLMSTCRAYSGNCVADNNCARDH